MCFVNHLLEDLDYNDISCSCFIENIRSARVIKKYGFKFYGKHLYKNFDGTKKFCNYYIKNLKEG